MNPSPNSSEPHFGDGSGRPVLLLRGGPDKAHALFKAMRPHQWVKNLLVFLPVFAAHAFAPGLLLASLLAFAAFSLVASGTYLINDLLDLAADRAHPRKRHRPLAAARLTSTNALALAAFLIAGGLLMGAALGTKFTLTLLAYLALTLIYSLLLKRRLIIDICTLAGLYTLRIVAGGMATAIPLSTWLLAFSLFIFLSLAAVKRQGELVDSKARGDLFSSGRGYHVDDLPMVAQIAIASGYASVLVMALYLNSAAVTGLYRLPEALWGICIVLTYWITRMVMLAHRGRMHDDPIVFAVKDPGSLFCALAVGACVIAGVWPW